MLVDRHAPEKAKALPVILRDHDMVSSRTPRTRNDPRIVAPADVPPTTPPRFRTCNFSLCASSKISVNQPPVPASAEPDATCCLQRSNERLRVGLGPILGVEDFNALQTHGFGKRLAGSLHVDLVATRRRDQDNFGIDSPREHNESPCNLRTDLTASNDH